MDFKRLTVSAHVSSIERKFASGGSAQSMRIAGYASTFGYQPDAYGDIIAKGAFADAERDARTGRFPRMLLQHGGASAWDSTPVGAWDALEEDSHGLQMRGRLANTGSGRTLWELMTMEPYPALDSLSIGYIPLDFSTRDLPFGVKRKLTRIKLYEVSIVSIPANSAATFEPVKRDAYADLQAALRNFRSMLDKPASKRDISGPIEGLNQLNARIRALTKSEPPTHQDDAMQLLDRIRDFDRQIQTAIAELQGELRR